MKRILMLVLLGALACGGASRARAGGDVGEPAPDFTFENVLDSAPDVFTLSDHLGSVVVIAFFAHW